MRRSLIAACIRIMACATGELARAEAAALVAEFAYTTGTRAMAFLQRFDRIRSKAGRIRAPQIEEAP